MKNKKKIKKVWVGEWVGRRYWLGGVSERMKGEEERERKDERGDIVSVLNDHFNTV